MTKMYKKMMEKLSFVCDDQLDALFPAQRLCRVKMELNDGRIVDSPVFEPSGEAKENVGYDRLAAKFRRITQSMLSTEEQESIIELIRGDNWTVQSLVDRLNEFLLK